MGTTTTRGYRKPASTDNFSNLPVDIGNVADDVNADMEDTWGKAWTDWSASFVWTAATTNPTKGNSSYSARYRYTSEHSVLYVVRLVIGSTFAAGTGLYRFGLPVAPVDAGGFGAVGNLHMTNAGAAEYIGICRIDTNTIIGNVPGQDGTTSSGHPVAAGQVTGAFPFALGAGDLLEFSIEYEV